MKVQAVSSLEPPLEYNQDQQFFRTTTGIQSGSDAVDDSRFGMTFLIILGVTEIYSYRLVLGRENR